MSVADKKNGFTLVELVVVIIIIGALVGLLLPVTRATRGAGRRMMCSNNFKQIALAMLSYHDKYQSLPPAYTVDAAGNRMHSWRTLLLPFLDEERLYQKIDLAKPWNDPVNRKIAEGFVPSVFRCPEMQEPKTLYQVVVDPEGCFPGATATSLNMIKDGASNTLLIVEVPLDKGVDWMSPNDTDWSTLSAIDKKSKLGHHQTFMTAFLDGHVFGMAADFPASLRRSLLTIAAGDPIDSSIAY